jgi:hypothetical protein
MIKADLKGILIPLLQQAAEARYMSILTINASKNSLIKITPLLALYSSVKDRVIGFGVLKVLSIIGLKHGDIKLKTV